VTAVAENQPISVVIPHYESHATLGRAIASILNQTLLPAEIIVIDDASSPDSQRVARAIVDSVANVECHFETLEANSGAGAARNAGWDLARHPFLAFLDADDSWLPRKLELQLPHFLAGDHYDAVGHQTIVDAGGASIRPLSEETLDTSLVALHPNQWLLRNYFSTSTVMLRRKLPFRFLTDGRYAEDYDLWLRMAFAGHPMAFLPAPLAVHHKARFGSSGLSADLWAMERGELRAFASLQKSEGISRSRYCEATSFSLAKFLLRIVRVNARGLLRP
jgi:glycosyltransferase involved in cell wall biosynthesis